MIKKSLIVASLLLAGTSAMAQNYFIGVDYLNLDTTATFTLTDANGQYSESDSEKDKNFNFKFGMDNVANGRVYLKI